MSIIETIDEALDDWSVSGDAMRWTPDSDAHRGELTPRFPRVPTLRLTLDVEPFIRAMKEVARVAAQLGPILERVRRELAGTPQHRPAPLCIDGHAYRQRQRNRKRRR